MYGSGDIQADLASPVSTLEMPAPRHVGFVSPANVTAPSGNGNAAAEQGGRTTRSRANKKKQLFVSIPQDHSSGPAPAPFSAPTGTGMVRAQTSYSRYLTTDDCRLRVRWPQLLLLFSCKLPLPCYRWILHPRLPPGLESPRLAKVLWALYASMQRRHKHLTRAAAHEPLGRAEHGPYHAYSKCRRRRHVREVRRGFRNCCCPVTNFPFVSNLLSTPTALKSPTAAGLTPTSRKRRSNSPFPFDELPNFGVPSSATNAPSAPFPTPAEPAASTTTTSAPSSSTPRHSPRTRGILKGGSTPVAGSTPTANAPRELRNAKRVKT